MSIQKEIVKQQAMKNIFSYDIKKGETIHVILEVSDTREFNLTRYQRVIIKAE